MSAFTSANDPGCVKTQEIETPLAELEHRPFYLDLR